MLCCEIAYWGGWSLLCEDTRAPLRRTFLAIAAARGFVVSAGEQETLDRCTDLETLVRWTVGLARASNVSEAMVG